MKKRGLITIIIFILIFSTVNLFLFSNKNSFSYSSISGKFIKEPINLPEGITISKIAFAIQWVILLIILIFAYVRFRKHQKEEKIRINLSEIKRKKSRSETELDILYNLLKEKKKLRIKTIARVFKIPKEKALDWGKILENSELVKIEYPAFSDPEVKLNEKEKKGKEIEEQKEGKKKGKEIEEQVKIKKPFRKLKKKKS